MIMMHERADRRSQVRFAEEHHSIQTLRFGRPDKPFGERVQIGTPRWKDQWLHATVAQQAPKRRGVQRVAIEDDALQPAQEPVARVGQVPGQLRQPSAVRLRRDPAISTVRVFSLMTKKTT